MAYAGKIIICIRVETVSEKLLYITATKLAWQQADIVNHQQAGYQHCRATVVIGGWHPGGLYSTSHFYLHQTVLLARNRQTFDSGDCLLNGFIE